MGDKYVVLVVDDSDVLRNMVKVILRDSFSNVIIAAAINGEKALKVMGGVVVNLVITDINMPEMGGLELISAIRGCGIFREVPIIAMSAEDDNREKAKQAGAEYFLKKPFSVKELVEEVEKGLKINA